MVKLIPVWDDNDCGKSGGAIFSDDNTCSCGIGKHHYHCEKCGKVVQVG